MSPTIFPIPNGIRFVEIGPINKVQGIVRAVVEAKKVVSDFKPDILHVHYLGSYGLLGLFLDADATVVTPWGSDVIEGKRSLWKRPVIRRILQKADMVTCDAYHMRREVMNFGVPEKRITIINFGIDTQRFSRRQPDQQVQRQYGLCHEPTVISLRNFEPVYDLETLVNAVPLVLKKVPDVSFVLVGKGSLEGKLRELVKSLGVDAAVKFAGFVPNDQLPDTLCCMSIYVSTSLSDAGIAASTAEAMACELPVVVTDTGENDQWITDGENGFLVPAGQPDILAGRLIRLLEDAELRDTFGKKGRKTILEKNDYVEEMSKMTALYKKLLSDR